MHPFGYLALMATGGSEGGGEGGEPLRTLEKSHARKHLRIPEVTYTHARTHARARAHKHASTCKHTE